MLIRSCKLRRRTKIYGLLVAVVLVALGIGLAIGLGIARDHDDLEQQRPNDAPSFPYPCYSSTLDIFTAQIELSDDEVRNNPRC